MSRWGDKWPLLMKLSLELLLILFTSGSRPNLEKWHSWISIVRGLDHKFMKHSKMGVASQVGPLSTLMTQRESVGSMVVNSGLFYVSGGPSKSLMALGHNRIVRLESFYRNFLGFRNFQFILNTLTAFFNSHGKRKLKA